MAAAAAGLRAGEGQGVGARSLEGRTGSELWYGTPRYRC